MGTASLSVANASVTEGDSGEADLTFTVSLSPAAGHAVTVAWATSKETGDTATPGTDYTAGSGTLSFAAGATSKTVTVKVTGDQVDEANETLTLTLSNATGGADIGDATATGTITDDDTRGIVLSKSAVTVTEASGTGRTASYKVKLATKPTGTVTVAVSSGTTTAATVNKSSLSFTTTNWNTDQTVTVTGVDDSIDNNPDRTATVGHRASGGDYGSVSKNLTVTVTDDEGTASLSVANASVTEGDSGEADLTFTVSLSPAAGHAVTVAWATSKETGDTATPGTDYTAGSGTLSFAAGATSKTVTVKVTGDQVDEANETLTLTLSNATGGADIGDATATGTITDDDTRGIVLSKSSVTVTEASGTGRTASYKVKLATKPTGAVTVAVSSGTTTAATVNKSSLSFTTTNWNTDQTVTVTGVDDSIDNNPDRTATVGHRASGGDYGSVSKNLTVTVTDDEGTASLSVANASVTEGDSGEADLTFTVSLSPAAGHAVTVAWATSKETGDTATPGTDYTAGSGTLSFAAGATSKTVTVKVTGDQVDEANETLTLTLSNATGGADIGDATATGTITDDDTRGIVLSKSAVTVTEASGTGRTASYKVKLASKPTGAVTVAVSSGTTTATTVNKSSLSFTTTNWNTDQTVTVTGVDDSIDNNPDRTATVGHRASGGDYGTVSKNLTVTVTDDEGAASLSVANASVTEGDSGEADLTFTVSLSPAAGHAVTVAWATSKETGDTATPGTDYTAGSGTLSFAAGATSKTVTVKVTGDQVDEANETLTLTLSNATGGDIGDATATGTITDDDTRGIVLSKSAVTVTEASGTTNTADYKVKLATKPTGAVTVAVSSGTTTAATVNKSSLSFTTTNWNTDQTVTVTGVDDSIDNNPDRTATVGHRASGGDYGSVSKNLTVTVTDDEGTASLSVANASVTEGDSGEADLTFTVSLSPAAGHAVTVAWATSKETGDTATPGTDYTAGSGSLSFAAGATSKTVTVKVTGDQVDEANETLTLTLSNASGADIGDATATGTITDDDAAPTGITLTASPDSVTENGGAKTVTVTASVNGTTRYAAAKTVTVAVGKSADSATEGTDYSTVADLTIAIAAGAASVSKSFTLTPTNDAVDEPNETISVEGTSSGVTVTADQITITDDDATPTLTLKLSKSSISENGGATTVTATLSAASSQSVTVTVSAAPVSPAVSGDYTLSANKTLTIAAGQTSSTGTVTITAVDNSVDAADKQVTVSGAASGGNGAANPASKTLTITDDDGIQNQERNTNPESSNIVLSVSPRSVAESASATSVTVTAELPVSNKRQAATVITVSVGGSADTATEGTDYRTVADFTLTIAAGASSGTAIFSIEPIDDAINEGDETLSISGSTTVSGLSVSGTQLTITDYDATPTVILTLYIPNPTADLQLNPTTVSENGGVAMITATLSNALTSALTIEISATPVSPATEDDYVLSNNRTLTVEAGSTDSTGAVNLTAVDNMMDSADKEVTISGTVNSDSGISDPLDRTLTIIDDDKRGLILSEDRITVTEAPGYRNSRTYKVSLATQPTDTVHVDLNMDDDQMITVEPQFLMFETSDWREEHTVVVTGMDNESVADDPEQRVMVYHAASGGDYGSMVEPLMVMVMDDDMPASENRADLQPWLVRFGRTVTDQALDLVTARLNRSPAPGGNVSLAGQSLKQWTPDSDVSPSAIGAANSYQYAEDSSTDIHAMETAVERDNFSHLASPRDNAQTRTLSEKELLAGSSFSLTMELDNTGHSFASLWGEGVVTSFEGEAGSIRLDGRVSSGFVGFDFTTHEETTGLSLGYSRGKGTYSDTDCDDQNCDGSILASLTGVYPFGKFQVTDRMSLWVAAGIGDGEVTFEQSDGEISKTNLSYAMAAIGMRNEITDARADDGFSLAWKTDARFTRITSDQSGSLAGTASEVSLLRLGLEGSRSIQLGRDGMALTPSFGLNLRYDGGDAEKGLGAELQGGLSFVDQKKGLSLDIAARGLIAHNSKGFREKSVSAALAWDPNSASDEGVSLSLKHSWSSMPSGGQALNSTLWENSIAGLSASDSENVSQSTQLIRTSLEIGYGMSAFNGRFIATPNFAIESSSDSSRNLRLGWKLSSVKHSDSIFTLSADITRDISAGNPEPEHGFTLSADLRF